MTDSHTAFLSIGSNVGDKKTNLNAAIDRLNQEDGIRVVQSSQYYKTEPQNFTDQDWFVNAVLKIETDFNPEKLLDRLKQIETQLDLHGKPFRFGPRIIDLDIIYFDDLVYKTEKLEIPHPRMHERCFVLVPLCDIAAGLKHPVIQLSSQQLLNNIEKRENQEVHLLDKED